MGTQCPAIKRTYAAKDCTLHLVNRKTRLKEGVSEPFRAQLAPPRDLPDRWHHRCRMRVEPRGQQVEPPDPAIEEGAGYVWRGN